MYDLSKLHGVLVEILDEVDRICTKHGLEYSLIAGTLLGAVRHGGFIPWDDDLDLGMPRKDYERFLELAPKELSEGFYLTHLNDGTRHFWLFAKVQKKNTLFVEKSILDIYELDNFGTGIYVDIFPFDSAKRKTPLLALRKKTQRLTQRVITAKSKTRIKSPVIRFILLLLRPLGVPALRRFCGWLAARDNGEQTDFLINFPCQYGFKRTVFLRDRLFPLAKISFCGREYPCFKDADYYLSTVYGPDYMQPPPPEARRIHDPAIISFDTAAERGKA